MTVHGSPAPIVSARKKGVRPNYDNNYTLLRTYVREHCVSSPVRSTAIHLQRSAAIGSYNFNKTKRFVKEKFLNG